MRLNNPLHGLSRNDPRGFNPQPRCGVVLPVAGRQSSTLYLKKMTLLRRSSILLGLILWVGFYIVDSSFLDILEGAASHAPGYGYKYGEMFGPLSYFRPLLLHGALAATVSAFILSWRER